MKHNTDSICEIRKKKDCEQYPEARAAVTNSVKVSGATSY